jgi:hypothetical protein
MHRLERPRSGSIKQRSHRAIDSFHLMPHTLERFKLRIIRVAASNQDVHGALDAGERILNLMSQACCQLANE